MKNIFTKIQMIFLCFTLAFIVAGCGSSAKDSDSISGLNPDEIVPSKEILVENLEDNGYTTTEHTAVKGVDLMIDRIVSEKGNKFIDITYGLTAEEAEQALPLPRILECSIYTNKNKYKEKKNATTECVVLS